MKEQFQCYKCSMKDREAYYALIYRAESGLHVCSRCGNKFEVARKEIEDQP